MWPEYRQLSHPDRDPDLDLPAQASDRQVDQRAPLLPQRELRRYSCPRPAAAWGCCAFEHGGPEVSLVCGDDPGNVVAAEMALARADERAQARAVWPN